MERCPCCNARLSGAIHCPRCQANLDSIIASEQQAKLYLNHAMNFWFAHQPQLAIQSLTVTIKLKHTPSSLVFRDFIVRQQIQQIFALLLAKQITEAKKTLYALHELQPNNELIKQLLDFTHYLSNKKAHAKMEYKPSTPSVWL